MPHDLRPSPSGYHVLEDYVPEIKGKANGEANGHSKGVADGIAAEIARLSELKPLDYDRERKDVAKRLGVKVGTLDAEVNARRPKAETGGVDFLPTVKPWHKAVEGAALLDGLSATIGRHVGLPEGGACAVALWILHAHALDAAAETPVLGITSPTPECGKSTLLALVKKLSPCPLPASNITPAAVFRAIEKWHPTLLIDEADTFLRDNDELRGVLNSGHGRDSAFVVRNVGDDHEPRFFSTWAAKAIALIGELPNTLASRAIHITMRRLASGETVEPIRFDKADYLHPLARQAARWAADNLDALKATDPDMPEGFTNRRADNWRPLLAIADLAGGDWPERARMAATKLDKPDAGQTMPILLLADIRELFTKRHESHISSADIVAHLTGMDDRPWAELKGGKPITKSRSGKCLSRMNQL